MIIVYIHEFEFKMSLNQLKLDRFWTHKESTSAKPDSTTNEPNQWRPLSKNTFATTSMRTIQIIDPIITAPSSSKTGLKHIQSTQNLFSIGKRMPEIEVALKQILANMETCPKPEDELPQPVSLQKVNLHGYQRHALAWMQWREANPPFGGLILFSLHAIHTNIFQTHLLFFLWISCISFRNSCR